MITKTLYVDYCSCPRLYYLGLHNPELGVVSEYDMLIIEQGNMVGRLARTYFEDTVTVNSIGLNDKYYETIKYIKDGYKTIAEASFIYNDLFCAVDLLRITEDGLEVYEVKSSTSVKPEHYDDLSFQVYVLEKLGYKVSRACLVHVNNKYVYNNKLDLNEYFAFEEIDLKDNVEENLNEIRKINSLPLREYSGSCKDCSFKKECFKDVPSPNVTELAGCRSVAKFFNSGIISFKDLISSNVKLNNKEIQQIRFELEDLPTYVDKDQLRTFINNLEYPLYHLDFETIEDVIPFINGTHPRFQRVIQYSLHIQKSTDFELEHIEYLQTEQYDNLVEVAESLIKNLGTKGSIVAYHAAYERGRIKALSEILPQYKNKLNAIINRIVDLEEPFAKRYVYNKGQKGKSSIKKVLPTYCKDFENAYSSLPLVHNGTEAMSYFSKMLNSDGQEKEDIKNGLLKYCALDTLAMVEVLKVLYKLIE